MIQSSSSNVVSSIAAGAVVVLNRIEEVDVEAALVVGLEVEVRARDDVAGRPVTETPPLVMDQT